MGQQVAVLTFPLKKGGLTTHRQPCYNDLVPTNHLEPAMTFFTGLTTVEKIKGAYRDLARKHHPDLGGDLETMKALNAAYHAALASCNGQEDDGRTYRYTAKTEQAIMDQIAELLKIPNLDISLIGLWVWVTGDTKPVKEDLKALGCRWHSGRKCWFWKPAGLGRSRSNPGSLNEIADKYGCERFYSRNKQLAAA